MQVVQQHDGTEVTAIPIHFIGGLSDEQIKEKLSDVGYAQYLKEKNLLATKRYISILYANGQIDSVLFNQTEDPFDCGLLPKALPKGLYFFADPIKDIELCYLGFMLGAYTFDKYKSERTNVEDLAKIVFIIGTPVDEIIKIYDAIALTRDLINEPTNIKTTSMLCDVAKNLAKKYNGTCQIIEGTELEEGFPLVYAVGKASANPPRFIVLKWGRDPKYPHINLVGKGVCFDSGGLGIKPASSMALMKKDMGGAASVLALAKLIMSTDLKLNLTIAIPVVENSISGNAFRPGDIYTSRSGKTVEIGHTDAEGRLILADALSFVQENSADLTIDIATLTGAARVAMGPKVPPFFTGSDEIARGLADASEEQHDPLWRLPLFEKYATMLKSNVADINNISNNDFAGCIIAALFLKAFVKDSNSWVHFDIYGWNLSSEPSAPVGGEAQCIRAIYSFLKKRYNC